MPGRTGEDVIPQLDRVGAALEAPGADMAAILGRALDWLSGNPPQRAADALYYRDRPEVIRQRHGMARRIRPGIAFPR